VALGFFVLPILVLWFRVVHENDEILALVRNEVVTDAAGQRAWAGSFVNTNERTLRDVTVAVDRLPDGRSCRDGPLTHGRRRRSERASVTISGNRL